MDKKKIAAPKLPVPALERASRLLDLVALSHEPVQISAAARELGMAKSSMHSLFSTLIELGLLERCGSGVTMGGKVMFWAHAFASRSDLASAFFKLWQDQAEPCDETVTLTLLDGPDVIYIASQAGTDPLSITFKTGMRLPAAFTATGKAILSTFPDKAIDTLYANGLPAPLTPYSVGSVAALRQELQTARAQGYSVDNQQVRPGMFCVGAPIYDFSSDRAVGGIALSVHAYDQALVAIDDLRAKVLHYAERLSQRLGARQGCAGGA